MPRAYRAFPRGWLAFPNAAVTRRVGRYPTPYVNPLFVRNEIVREEKRSEKERGWSDFTWKVLEGSAVTLLSLIGLGAGGYTYNKLYKQTVLDKIENAFSAGYSSNELGALGKLAQSAHSEPIDEFLAREFWVPRVQQPLIDAIINGSSRGKYHIIFGEKGTGKLSLLLEAMRKVNGDGIAMLEAHSDLEVFRVRIGRAIDFEFHEDYIGSLFNIRGPRDSTPLLDIERALNKMEKVALDLRKKRGKPLLLIVTNIHLFKDNPESEALLELFQQRAETWASNDLVTVVFSSDEFWTLEKLRPRATHMQVLHIPDVSKEIVIESLRRFRATYYHENVPTSILEQVYQQVGGRLIFLNQIAESKDMLAACKAIYEREKAWLLQQCWILGADIDEHVEEQQTYCASAFVLAKSLVELEERTTHTSLPAIPLHEARQIMTRADLIQELDHANIMAVDEKQRVKAHSVPMQNAFREICTQPWFDDHLEATLKRLEECESLGRTREVVMKDLLGDGQYRIMLKSAKGEYSGEYAVQVQPKSNKGES